MIAKIDQLVQLALAELQSVRLPNLSQAAIDVLRLDKIHPIISGNKWFKLKYALHQTLSENKKSIVTVGGAYSNHILATACVCKEIGLSSIGLIKAEEPKNISCTLEAARSFNMQIEFLPRTLHKDQSKRLEYIMQKYQSSYLVEEGGQSENGIRGAQEILALIPHEKYDYICCSIGTGTMMTGLVRTSLSHQRVVGICSLKITQGENELSRFIQTQLTTIKNYEIIYDYHFGGYAKHNKQLLEFMNDLYLQTSIPTDFVYTGKLFYAVLDLMKQGYFEKGKNILIIHSGGLQGNCSLPQGTLLF